MGDSLNELLDGIIWILDQKKEYPIGMIRNDKDSFSWNIDEEGSTVDFEFNKTKDKDSIKLKIIQHYNESKCMFDGNINFNEFLSEVINSCSEILNTNGFIGYHWNWMDQRDFPIAYYLIIKNYLEEEKNNCKKELFTDDKYMSPIYKTISEKEIKLIK